MKIADSTLKPLPLSAWILVFFLASCTYTQKIKDGNTAFERKQFAVAIPFLKKEYEKQKSRVEQGKLAFLIGESYRQMNQPEKAIPWYETAYNFQYGLDALKAYAFALKQSGQYAEAADAFKNLGIELGSPYEYRKEMKACQIAQAWEKEAGKAPYHLEAFPVNSNASDYAPFLLGKDQLAFTSDRASATGEETYFWTGSGFSDIFVTNTSGTSVELINLPINSEDHEGTLWLNSSITELFFTRCYSTSYQDAWCKILHATLEEGQWTTPQPLPFCKDGINYGHPTLSADEGTLYFSANAPDGWGGYDIYFSERTPNGWSDPTLMSRSINTAADEKFPVIEEDTLYFASTGHTGMGGLDIFKSYKLGNNTWSPAYNLKPPVNSASDDFGLIIDRRMFTEQGVSWKGYLSSSRPGGFGMDDIYLIEKRIQKTDEEPVPVNDIVFQMRLDIFILEKIFELADDPNSKVLGRKTLPNASLQVSQGDSTFWVQVGSEGSFQLSLKENTDYYFLAQMDNYLSKSARFSTRGIGKDPANPSLQFELEIELDKIFVNTEIQLENIYYDFDEAFIREDAKPTLDELVAMLKENPEILIELGSHTDCRGSNKYNLELSQRRAQSAVDYLISRGVAENRLSAIGYGENNPTNTCACATCTEEEHQENRRTTFKIVE